MIFCDTHTHLYLKEFDEDRDEVMRRAKDAGIEYFFLPNIDSGSIDAMKSLSSAYPANCFPMMGLHPTSVKENYRQELKLVEQHLNEGAYYAIGEVGIDLYWDDSFREQQFEAFRHQIMLSLRHRLPLVIHSRDSFDEIMNVLDEFKGEPLRGIFHCFTGSEDQALKIIEKGFLLGIGGVLTFKNSKLRDNLKKVPIEKTVLETDAPFLTPMPYRGKRNESSYIRIIAEQLADTKNISLEKLSEITSNNALTLFGLKQ